MGDLVGPSDCKWNEYSQKSKLLIQDGSDDFMTWALSVFGPLSWPKREDSWGVASGQFLLWFASFLTMTGPVILTEAAGPDKRLHCITYGLSLFFFRF